MLVRLLARGQYMSGRSWDRASWHSFSWFFCLQADDKTAPGTASFLFSRPDLNWSKLPWRSPNYLYKLCILPVIIKSQFRAPFRQATHLTLLTLCSRTNLIIRTGERTQLTFYTDDFLSPLEIQYFSLRPWLSRFTYSSVIRSYVSLPLCLSSLQPVIVNR